MAALADAAQVTLIVSGTYGVLNWTDTGLTGVAPAGSLLVRPGAGMAYRGLVVLP